ncbi:hypothetical protein ACRTAO_001106 [Clostridium perfringens]
MFKVSEAFNKEINKLQGRKFNAKVIIRDKEYSGNQIYEMNLEESVNPSDSFSIGSICSNSFDIKLINTGDIFDNAIVKPYVGLYVGDDIEYIPLGVFTVIKTSVKGKFINLECVDNMLGLEKVYFSDLSYPADINDIAKEICKKAGVNLASKLPNYRVNKIEGYSLREAIGFIASLCGSFARFNRIGDLEVRDYEVVKQEMTPHNLFKLDIEANECIIKKVIAKKGEEELSTGTDDGNKIVFNNPIINKEILSDIYTKYNGFKYIPYTAKWKGNPAIMAGDILNLTDLNGNKYNALIMEQKFTYKNGISSEVKAKGKTRQDSSFDSKGSVTQSMERYSIEQANIKKALIDKASINDLTAVDAKIQRLYTDDLTAIRADIVTLNSQKANIVELNSIKADLQQAIIGKANITDLNAAIGKINVLESKTASIENALNKNLTAENIATGAITAGSGIIAEGAIGDAEISSLSVNKLKVGDITTSKHRIVSADGTIEIVGNQILINRNNVNRVILGEYRKTDSTTDYGLLIRGKDGKTIMFDSDGVHNAGITNGAIDNNKVADNANISGNKLDINSVIREVNTHGTETIKGTKVTVGDRTLDVELSTQKNTITEHGKELSSQKATIQALDSAIKLKVDSQTFTQSTQTINSNITRAKEQAIIGARSIPDTRNSNESPGWYMQHYAFQTITEFKYANVIGVPNGGSWFGTLETTVPWNNSSGGYPTQVFRSNSSPVYQRHGTDLNTWNSWEQIEDTQGSQAKANNALSNAKSYSDSKKQEAIKAAENLALEKSNLAKKYAEDVATAKANLAKTEAIANADGKISAEEKKRIQQAQENLNTAISKADKAKQDAILEANRVAELKKQEAISSANSHADNKANEALNNAKAFVNAEITTVNSHLNKATAEINVLKEKIELKVSQSDVDKVVENVKFGNRNYLKNSLLNTTNSDYCIARLYFGDEKPQEGEEFTVSIKGELGEGKSSFGVYNSGGTVSLISLDNKNSDGIYKGTFKWRIGTSSNTYLSIYTIYSSVVVNSSIEWVKLEKGNKVSNDWTPSPEDTKQLIVDNIKTVTDKITTVESKFTQENNSIKASVQDLNSTTQTITTNVSNINRDLTSKINSNLDAAKSFATDIAIAKANLAKEQAIASADGKITAEEQKRIQQAQANLNTAIAKATESETKAKSYADVKKQEAINTASTDATNKANNALNSAKAFVNAEITTVNNKVHNVESNLNILKDQIKSKVSQSDIDKSISNITIGGRNLALGTSLNYSNPYSGFDGGINKCPSVAKVITDGLKVGDIVTVRLLYKYENIVQASGKTNSAWLQGAGDVTGWGSGAFSGSVRLNNFSGNGTYEFLYSFTVTKEHMKNNYWDVNLRHDYILSGSVCWKMFKVEKGNKATDWTPAPEDINSLIVDNIKVVDTKISGVSSSVTQIRDSVTTQINSINSKTQSIETTLNGKATKQEVTEVNNRVATIKANLDSITQRVSSTESKTQTLEININGKASKEEIVSINSKVASIETSLSGITNRVSSTESKTSSLEFSINSTNSELNILKNSISTKLEKIDSHIKYGSTNLLINTEFLNNFYNWNKNQYVGLDKYQEKDYVGVMIQNNRIGTEGTLWQRATLKTEVTYTLSFEEYTDDISRLWVGIYYKLNGATKYITLFDSSVNKHSWQKRVFQFKLPSGATETDVSFYNYGGSVGRVWVCNLQLEEGEFATPYKSNPLDFSKFSSAITQTVEGINTEVSKKVNGRDIISTINQSAESVKINASRINLQGYVTVGDLGSTNVTTINNAHITSGTIEGRTMIALNGTGKQNGVLTVNNGESYLEYFRCREAWMMSPYANGWRVPLVHSKYGIKDNESSSDMIDEIAFYRGTDGRNYLQITNTKTGRVEYIELYRSAFDTVTILNRLDRIDAKLAGL